MIVQVAGIEKSLVIRLVIRSQRVNSAASCNLEGCLVIDKSLLICYVIFRAK